MTQVKCVRCRVRWTWNGSPLLRDAYCPQCHAKLYQTSHRLSWPMREKLPCILAPSESREPQEATA